MTPAEHYAATERCLEASIKSRDHDSATTWAAWAQVHATLALVPPASAASMNRAVVRAAATRWLTKRGEDLLVDNDLPLPAAEEAQDSAIADLVDVILAAAGHP